MSRPWIKIPSNKINDVRLVSFISLAARGVYYSMYTLAGQLDETDGLFFQDGRQLTDKEIAARINVKLPIYKSALNELKREKLLHVNGKGPQIIDWPVEQINWREKQKKDAEYQQTHRAKTSDGDDVSPDSENVKADGDSVNSLDQKKKKTRPEEDKKKTRPTPTPSTKTKGKSSATGRKAGDKVEDESLSFDQLSTKQQKRADRVQKVLASLGIRNPKLKTTSTILATRHFKNDEQMMTELCGAIASVYSDINAKSKEAVILHRLENNSIPRSFIEDKKLWRSIPPQTLALAGIEVNDQHDKLINKLHQRAKESNE